jgi:hypothetical protein
MDVCLSVDWACCGGARLLTSRTLWPDSRLASTLASSASGFDKVFASLLSVNARRGVLNQAIGHRPGAIA